MKLDVCEEKVQNIIKEKLINESEPEIDCCHWMKKNDKAQLNNEWKSHIRTIICKSLWFKITQN